MGRGCHRELPQSECSQAADSSHHSMCRRDVTFLGQTQVTYWILYVELLFSEVSSLKSCLFYPCVCLLLLWQKTRPMRCRWIPRLPLPIPLIPSPTKFTIASSATYSIHLFLGNTTSQSHGPSTDLCWCGRGLQWQLQCSLLSEMQQQWTDSTKNCIFSPHQSLFTMSEDHLGTSQPHHTILWSFHQRI